MIQDVGLVYLGCGSGQPLFDVWAAGGLGREPQPAFLLERNLPESTLIPYIERIIDVYKRDTPAGKRLKHLVREIGTEEFLRRFGAELAGHADLVISRTGIR